MIIICNSVALYHTFLNMKYISLCYNSFGFEYFAQYCSKFDLYSKKNICHINENIIGILIMSMNVCLIIRCKNKHIQKVTEITLLKILTFVSFCRIVTGWAWRFQTCTISVIVILNDGSHFIKFSTMSYMQQKLVDSINKHLRI